MVERHALWETANRDPSPATPQAELDIVEVVRPKPTDAFVDGPGHEHAATERDHATPGVQWQAVAERERHQRRLGCHRLELRPGRGKRRQQLVIVIEEEQEVPPGHLCTPMPVGSRIPRVRQYTRTPAGGIVSELWTTAMSSVPGGANRATLAQRR